MQKKYWSIIMQMWGKNIDIRYKKYLVLYIL